MKRAEMYAQLNSVDCPESDFLKILSNLHYTHHFLIDRYRKILQEWDITPAQSNVMGIIDCYGENGASLEQIKEMVLEPHSDVSRTVTRLVSKAYAEKVLNASNKRKVEIRLTSSGKNVLAQLRDSNSMRQITSGLSLDQARNFCEILDRLRKAAP